MNSKRLYLGLIGAIGVLVIGLIVGTYQINALLGNKAAELTKIKAKSMALDEEKKSLTKAKKDIIKYEELHKITQSVVPEDKNQALVVRELVNIAEKNGIALASVTFPASSLGAATAGAATPKSTQPASSSSSASDNKAGALSQLVAVKDIPGVYSLTITVTSDPLKPVPYNQFVSFLNDLEHNRRTAQVNTVSIEPKKENRNLLSFTLSLNGYIKP